MKLHGDLEEVRMRNEESRRRSQKMSITRRNIRCEYSDGLPEKSVQKCALHVGIFDAKIATVRRIFRRTSREIGPKMCFTRRNIRCKLLFKDP
ncbi:hypothetical protein LINGRAHAP2_LOCUS31924 [Linum grandiflorum]